MISYTLDAGRLAAVLKILNGVIEKRNTIPILGGVHIAWTPGRGAIVTGTDLDIQASFAVPGTATEGFTESTEPVELVLNAAALAAFLKSAAKGNVIAFEHRPEVGGAAPAVKAALPSGAAALLYTYEPGGWPRMRNGDDDTTGESIALPAAQFADALTRCAPCMSTELTRYNLFGVAFAPKNAGQRGHVLCAVATNAHTLAEVELCGAPPAWTTHRPHIVPTKAVNLLRSLFKGAGDDVQITLSPVLRGGEGAAIIFDTAGVSIRTKLIDGQFPDWQRVVPSAGAGHTWSVAPKVLADVCKALLPTAGGHAAAFTLEGDTVTARVVNPESGAVQAPVPGSRWNGAGMEVGFNLAYLRDAALTCPGDTLCFELRDAGSPARLRAEHKGAPLPGWVHVLMPMRV